MEEYQKNLMFGLAFITAVGLIRKYVFTAKK